MANCGNCSAELKFTNTPLFGGNQLASGEPICMNCITLLARIDKKISIKKQSLDEVKVKLAKATASVKRVNEQLQKIGITPESRLLVGAEIAALPMVVLEDEELFGFVRGHYNGGQGVLVLTNKRLFFMDKGSILGSRVQDFWLDKVSSVEYEGGILFADIKIMSTGSSQTKITKITKPFAETFCETTRKVLSQPAQAATPVTVIQQPVDVADQLGKLAALKEQGILSQEEFDGQKKKLLNL